MKLFIQIADHSIFSKEECFAILSTKDSSLSSWISLLEPSLQLFIPCIKVHQNSFAEQNLLLLSTIFVAQYHLQDILDQYFSIELEMEFVLPSSHSLHFSTMDSITIVPIITHQNESISLEQIKSSWQHVKQTLVSMNYFYNPMLLSTVIPQLFFYCLFSKEEETEELLNQQWIQMDWNSIPLELLLQEPIFVQDTSDWVEEHVPSLLCSSATSSSQEFWKWIQEEGSIEIVSNEKMRDYVTHSVSQHNSSVDPFSTLFCKMNQNTKQQFTHQLPSAFSTCQLITAKKNQSIIVQWNYLTHYFLVNSQQTPITLVMSQQLFESICVMNECYELLTKQNVRVFELFSSMELVSNNELEMVSQISLEYLETPNDFVVPQQNGSPCPIASIEYFFLQSKIVHPNQIIEIPHFEFDSQKYDYYYYLANYDAVQSFENNIGLLSNVLDTERLMKSYFRIKCEKSCIVQTKETRFAIQTLNNEKTFLPSTRLGDKMNIQFLFEEEPWKSLQELFCEQMTNNQIMTVLLVGSKGTSKSATIKYLSQKYGYAMMEMNCYEIVAESDSQTEDHIRQVFTMANMSRPAVIYWKNFEAIMNGVGGGDAAPSHLKHSKMRLVNALDELFHPKQNRGVKLKHPLLVICSVSYNQSISTTATTNASDTADKPSTNQHSSTGGFGIPLPFEYLFMEKIKMPTYLSKKQVQLLQTQLLKQSKLPLQEVTFHDALYLYRLSQQQMLQKQSLQFLPSKSLKQTLFDIQIPNVKWEDIGGLESVKKQVLDTIQLPLEKPELFNDQVARKRSGILLFGPPGNGKTLVAKAVCTECSLHFMSVKGPELINMYIGESERNIRQVFERAREVAPTVIFFDELDALAPNRGMNGDSGGVMDRITSQLLNELDGLHGGSSKPIFVIGATNRPDLIDGALMRPGRFDRMVYIGISKSKEDQFKIVKALTRKFKFENQQQKDDMLREVVEQCGTNLTGADFYALCSDAFMNATQRHIESSNASEHVLVTKEDFLMALKSLKPSLKEEDLLRYEQLQAGFK